MRRLAGRTSCSTGRSTTRPRCGATCATSPGSTAGSAARPRRGARSTGCSAGRTVPHTLLDVGTGAADIPLALLERGRAVRSRAAGDGRRLAPGGARRGAGRRPAARPRRRAWSCVVGDGGRCPWPDRSFDVVHASLVIHHLEPPDAVAFLREARAGSRASGVVVNDLVRARHHWIGARVLLAADDAQPVHAPRRAALGAAGVHAGWSCGRCSPARRCGRSPRSARSPGIGSRSPRSRCASSSATGVRTDDGAGARVSRDADVVVVGGGPAGAVAAAYARPGRPRRRAARAIGRRTAGAPAACSPRRPRCRELRPPGSTRRRSRGSPGRSRRCAWRRRRGPDRVRADVRRRDRRASRRWASTGRRSTRRCSTTPAACGVDVRRGTAARTSSWPTTARTRP